jgi:hypothetical protein
MHWRALLARLACPPSPPPPQGCCPAGTRPLTRICPTTPRPLLLCHLLLSPRAVVYKDRVVEKREWLSSVVLVCVRLCGWGWWCEPPAALRPGTAVATAAAIHPTLHVTHSHTPCLSACPPAVAMLLAGRSRTPHPLSPQPSRRWGLMQDVHHMFWWLCCCTRLYGAVGMRTAGVPCTPLCTRADPPAPHRGCCCPLPRACRSSTRTALWRSVSVRLPPCLSVCA